jgi:D-glycero-alpha-D-manno-heptose 1-phosphate guanylyltransferase
MGSQQGIKEAIILAGGLGTRLRSAVPDLPKCMAPVAGKPFLSYLIDYLASGGVQRFIFALGYKSEAIEEFLGEKFARGGTTGSARPVTPSRPGYKLSIEKEPLGTGGAIRLAGEQAEEDTVLVLNGDTFFGIDARELAAFHSQKQADCTLCLKPMQNFDRYGVVETGADGRVTRFLEKQFYQEGLINGGVYALNVPRFLDQPLPSIFSFEKDWLERSYSDRPLYGLVQEGYFIDIGIPADYERAQREAERLR